MCDSMMEIASSDNTERKIDALDILNSHTMANMIYILAHLPEMDHRQDLSSSFSSIGRGCMLLCLKRGCDCFRLQEAFLAVKKLLFLVLCMAFTLLNALLRFYITMGLSVVTFSGFCFFWCIDDTVAATPATVKEEADNDNNPDNTDASELDDSPLL